MDGSTGSAKLITSAADLDNVTIDEREVAAVLVDGQPVVAFDSLSKNLFAPVTIVAGDNPFELTAVDASGGTRTSTLTLVGTEDPTAIDFDRLENVTPRGALNYFHSTFNRQTRTLHTDVELTNIGPQLALPAPIVALPRT